MKQRIFLLLCLCISSCNLRGKSESELINLKGLWINKFEPDKGVFIEGDNFKTGSFVKLGQQVTVFRGEPFGGQQVDAKIDNDGDLIYSDDVGNQQWRWRLNDTNDTLICTVTGNDASYGNTLRYYKYKK